MKLIANAYIQGNLNYGISLWAKENIDIIDKLEKLRLKVVDIIYGEVATKNLNDEQKLYIIGWKN